MEKIVALCKRRGFVFPSSEIYGGLANAYDYGPYGAELLRNIRNLWWSTFIHKHQDMKGIDTQIILHPETWVASGHVASLVDFLVEDTVTHMRYRADHLIEDWLKKPKNAEKIKTSVVVENMSMVEMAEFIHTHSVKSPQGNVLTDPKKFNLLFETSLGTVADNKAVAYLRGETAQGIFTNFKNILDTQRVKLPFGIGQIGKSFRNEITSGQFVFRTFEFEQAEIEYFFDPEVVDWNILLEQWKKDMWRFVTEFLGISSDNLRWRRHTDKERSHYSKDTYDLDYKFPFGWKELWGVAYRTDYDLKQHTAHSGANLVWKNNETGKVFTPHVIEPALGINRAFFMVLNDAYHEEEVEGKVRTYLKLHPSLAPVKIAVFPLQKDDTLKQRALEVFQTLQQRYVVELDDAGNIGKMYRRQDEIGTPFCVTVDFQTNEDNSVTVRARDTMEQSRVPISDLEAYFFERL